MRLLVISVWYPWPASNGSRIRAARLLEELSKRHEITLLSFAEAGDDTEESRAALAPLCHSVEVVPGNPHKPPRRLGLAGLAHRVPRSYLRTFDPAMARLVAARLASADAAIALQVGASLYLRGRPTRPRLFEEAEVATIREAGIRARSALRRARATLTWKKTAAFVRSLVSDFDHTTVVSSVERDHLGDVGCDLGRVSVVPNGADAGDLVRPTRRRERRLIYSGSLTYTPNLEAMRFFVGSVLPFVQSACPGTTLWITGDITGVDVSGIAGREGVVLTGFLPDVKTAVADSAACVVPLLTGGGTRVKVLEALALGTPVVATSKAVEGLDVTDGCEVLVGDTAHAFADATVRILQEDGLAAALSARGRRHVEHNATWAHAGARLETALAAAIRVFANRHDRGTTMRNLTW